MLYNSELITIEEVLVKLPSHNYRSNLSRSLIRQFILCNRQTNLKIHVNTLDAQIVSCTLYENDKQILVTAENENTANESSMLVLNNNWNSHVYGFDAILLNDPSSSKSYTYRLTEQNEFVIEGTKQDHVTLNFTPFFFNLNSATEDQPSLKGHHLQVSKSLDYGDPIHVISISGHANSLGRRFIKQTMSSVSILIDELLNGFDFVYSSHTACCAKDPTLFTINDSSSPSELSSDLVANLRFQNRVVKVHLKNTDHLQSETHSQTGKHSIFRTNLRIIIKNGAIAFIPFEMRKFRISYRFI